MIQGRRATIAEFVFSMNAWQPANGLARAGRNTSLRVIPTLFGSHVLKQCSLVEVFQPRSLMQEGWQICQYLACE